MLILERRLGRMIEINDKVNCSGCTACYAVCPQSAIEMKLDEEGFKYPWVDKNRCVECGLCNSVCPILNKRKIGEENTSGYIVQNKNDSIRLKSTSGAAINAIAEYVISCGGVVFGCEFSDDRVCRHTMATDISDLGKFQGSKYVQSELGDCFKSIKEQLDADKKVLFIGMPCQVAGLESYIKRNKENLYLMDLACHGVPSPGVWKRYLKEQFGSNKVISMQFRNKTRGINDVTLDYTLTNGSVFREHYKESSYIQGFINNYYVRPSCFECKFKGIDRCSDITIGDFWSLKEFHPEMLNQYGVSSVIIHSKKGERWFKDCLDQLIYCVAKTEEIAIWNESLINTIDKDHYRNQFYEMWNNKKIEEIVYELNQSKIKTRNKQNKAIACIKRIVRRIKNG